MHIDHLPNDFSINKLFEDLVERTPNKIAVVDKMDKITYFDLNKRANQVANLLTETKITKEEVIGILIERSINMVIGMLGILKAGGAYLPIDPEYPELRINYILKNAKITKLLTDHDTHIERKVKKIEVSMFFLDDSKIYTKEDSNLTSSITENNLAYILYTSGSTGDPKGVMVEHKSIINLTKHANYVSILPNDNIAQLSSIAFDASTFEIWGALLNGATLVIIQKKDYLHLDEAYRLFSLYKISVLFITTALFNVFAQEKIEIFNVVEKILFGGEKPNVHIVNAVLNTIKDKKLIHMYGPTENTTFSTFYEIQKNTKLQNLPIGKPISNTTIFILDQNLQPISVGSVGELYLGGIGLARGYLNLPILTKKFFIPNPFLLQTNNKKESLTLYKTGDLVRCLNDGNILFIGRTDHQVKIRGYRIELDEIESILQQHPYVKESIVIMKNNKNNKYLAAYITLINKKNKFNIKLLHTYLEKKLPDYMIPSQLMIIDKMPLTINGKISKKALPDINMRDSVANKDSIEGNIQKKISKIWLKVLGIQKVRGDDNFFDLGGNSLLISVLVSRLNKILNYEYEIDIVNILQYPTINKLCKFLLKSKE